MEEKNEIRPKIGIGYHIGHLTVESDTGERKSGYTVWKCRCDCGGTIHLDTRCLQRGKVRDCGCRTKVRPGQNDLTGRRFGRLVCLEPTDESCLLYTSLIHQILQQTLWIPKVCLTFWEIRTLKM